MAIGEKGRWAEMAEELAGVGYWRVDASTTTIAWSPNMARMMGFDHGVPPSLDEAMSRIHPEDRKDADTRLESNLAGKTALTTLRVIWDNGEVRHLEIRNACEFDDAGKVVAILGAAVDITDLVRMQESLAESEQHFRQLADACPDIITQCDMDGKLTYLSPAVTDMLGYEASEAIGKTAYDFMHPADVKRLKKALAAYLVGPNRARPIRLDCRMIHKDGHVVWVESSPRAILDTVTGEVVQVQDIIRDVTILKRQHLRVA